MSASVDRIGPYKAFAVASSKNQTYFRARLRKVEFRICSILEIATNGTALLLSLIHPLVNLDIAVVDRL
jgi:hypothetical protein